MIPEEFVKTYLPYALECERETGISATFTLAQAALESGWGKHAPGNNFFGIKAGPTWKGKTQELLTREVINGKETYIDAPFRAYDSPVEGFRDHGQFFLDNPRYAKAVKFNRGNPRLFAQAIAKAGYATDQNYSALLIKIIDRIETIRGM